jgi:uncharacterized RDD family membrane protein YckC
MTSNNKLTWISGFWRRLGAFFIDILILVIVGLLLGLVLESVFVKIGAWGGLIGFSITLFYFGIMDSKFTSGQTFGKKALKIRVVNEDNQTINIFRSFVRYLVIGIPYFLIGTPFVNQLMSSFWFYPLSAVLFGGLISTVYLYLCNRQTRQSLHDLITGTFVVNANTQKTEVKPLWRPHFFTIGAILIIATITPYFISPMLHDESLNTLLETQSAIAMHPSVNQATLSYGTEIKNDSSFYTYVRSQIFLNENLVTDVELAKNLADIIIVNFPEAKNKNVIQLSLTYGYDIGIVSSWTQQLHNFAQAKLEVVN